MQETGASCSREQVLALIFLSSARLALPPPPAQPVSSIALGWLPASWPGATHGPAHLAAPAPAVAQNLSLPLLGSEVPPFSPHPCPLPRERHPVLTTPVVLLPGATAGTGAGLGAGRAWLRRAHRPSEGSPETNMPVIGAAGQQSLCPGHVLGAASDSRSIRSGLRMAPVEGRRGAGAGRPTT